jgi:hypothetical protein
MLRMLTCTCIYISKYSLRHVIPWCLARPTATWYARWFVYFRFAPAENYTLSCIIAKHTEHVFDRILFVPRNRYMRKRLKERSLPSNVEFIIWWTSETCRFIPHYDNGMLPCLIARRTILWLYNWHIKNIRNYNLVKNIKINILMGDVKWHMLRIRDKRKSGDKVRLLI